MDSQLAHHHTNVFTILESMKNQRRKRENGNYYLLLNHTKGEFKGENYEFDEWTLDLLFFQEELLTITKHEP